MMRRLTIACLLCLTSGWVGSSARAETRMGVIATKTTNAQNLASLLEIRLAERPATALVERNEIDKVLGEQELQALLVADAPGKRAALGKMLKADMLIFLAERQEPKPHLMVVVCESARGLRLCAEPVFLTKQAETDVAALLKKVEDAAKKQQEKLIDIVAVPPLLNNSLTQEADNLQGGLACFIEQTLLRRPGLLVVELAEAKALAREIALSGTPGIERRLPLYLMGEYRVDGRGNSRRGQFAWRLLRGENELGRREEKDLSWSKFPRQLQQAATELVDKAAGTKVLPSDPVAEAKHLADREHAFVAIGQWKQGLAMAEASLLLNPDQPAVHGDALHAILEMNGDWQDLWAFSPKTIPWLRAALPHLEAYFCGTKVPFGDLTYVETQRWGNDLRRGGELRFSPEVRKVLVYNLQTDAPNTFLANGLLVHNKGGGGGGCGGFGGGGFHGGSGSSSDSDFAGFLVFLGIVLTLVIAAKLIRDVNEGSSEDLDFVYSPAQVAKKSGKTVKLLEFLARQDPMMVPDVLRSLTKATFLELQQCWSARSYEPMRPLLMPDLFRDHSRQLAEMERQHELNVLSDLRVDRIDLVNVRYTFKEEQREFTALVTATACDYYIDDRTQAWLRGDKAPAQFQEFWTFQFHNKAWLLREVEQTRESDALRTENFFEQFTDTGVDQIYGKEAAKEGQAGPWLEKGVETKETRIERMLNFLVQTDKLWDREAMLETTRRIFLELTAARESGNPADAHDDDLFPELAAHFKETIASNTAQGIKAEFRNLCVRKVELILVRNFADKTQDEFVARVRAHAQKILLRNGQVVRQDEDVVPFEQYLTLGRLDNRWKLKEILSAEAGQAAVQEENLDQDSSPEQVQWYYQHTRAV